MENRQTGSWNRKHIVVDGEKGDFSDQKMTDKDLVILQQIRYQWNYWYLQTSKGSSETLPEMLCTALANSGMINSNHNRAKKGQAYTQGESPVHNGKPASQAQTLTACQTEPGKGTVSL